MQFPLIPVLSLPALLLVCSVAYADAPQYDERWYLAPGLEHISPSHNEGVLSGSGWQFALGVPLALRWDLEFGVVDYSLDFSDGLGGSADHTFYGAQGLWLFSAGLMIPFGGTRPGPTGPYTPPPVPMPAAATPPTMPSASTHAAPTAAPAAATHHR